MVKILVIRSGSIGTEDICNSLKSNGFGIETVAAEYITKAQLRCIACAMIICERKVLENKEIHAFLQNWTAPVLWIVDEKDLPAASPTFGWDWRIILFCRQRQQRFWQECVCCCAVLEWIPAGS